MAPAEHIFCSLEEKEAINIGVRFSISLNELSSDTSGCLDLERSYYFSRKSANVSFESKINTSECENTKMSTKRSKPRSSPGNS